MKLLAFFPNRALRPASTRSATKVGSLMAAFLLFALGGCGVEESSGGGSSTASNCPPEQKGDGVMVGSRYDYEDLLEANKWRTEMFDARCADDLAFMTPELPAGWDLIEATGVAVDSRDHVWVLQRPWSLGQDELAQDSAAACCRSAPISSYSRMMKAWRGSPSYCPPACGCCTRATTRGCPPSSRG